MIPAAIFTAGEKGLFEHANRVHPIYFEYPNEKADDVTIELPPGWAASSVPTEQKEDGRIIVYDLKVEKNAETLRLTRKLTNNILLLQQQAYPDLRNFFQAIRNNDGLQIVLQRGEIHAGN